MKFLCAIDDSMPSRKAFELTLRLMNKDNDELELLTVQDLGFMDTYVYPHVPYSTVEEAKNKKRRELTKLMEEMQRVATEKGITNVFSKVLEGTAKDCICNEAEAQRVNMVVVGSRGANPFTKLLLGSVTDYVTRYHLVPL